MTAALFSQRDQESRGAGVSPSPEPVSSRDRKLWFAVRQALRIALGAVEDYLEVPRSVQPKRLRRDF